MLERADCTSGDGGRNSREEELSDATTPVFLLYWSDLYYSL